MNNFRDINPHCSIVINPKSLKAIPISSILQSEKKNKIIEYLRRTKDQLTKQTGKLLDKLTSISNEVSPFQTDSYIFFNIVQYLERTQTF